MTSIAVPTVSTPTLSSPGLGSGLDVSSIVQQLVSADTSGQTTLLGNQQSTVQSELSAVSVIQSAASSLNSAISALTGGSGLGQQSVNVSDGNVLSASSDGTAQLGNHSVVVNSLARSQQLASQAFASSDATVGSGTLTLTVGGKAFSLDLSSGATLAQVRDAINGAANNSGVTATIISADDGAHLILTSDNTGTANTITVSDSGGDGGLAALDYGSGTGGLSQYQAAADAQVSIDGYTVTSGSNTISNALQGVTLNLATAAPGETVTLGIAQNTQAISTAVNSFVQAYNTLNAAITQETSYDSSTGTAAPLLGNPGISTLSQQLRRIAGTLLSGGTGFTSLAQIGITTNTDGSISVDSTALASALAQNPTGVSAILTGSSGVATQMSNLLTNDLADSGMFSAQTTSFQSQLSSISDQQSALTDRTNQLTQMYTAQFTALDTLMSQMQATSSYLTQALAALPTISSSSSSSSS